MPDPTTAPAAAPAAQPAPASQPTPAAAPAPAPAAPAPAAPPAKPEAQTPSTLLTAEPPKPEAKPGEPSKDEKPADYTLKVPEGVDKTLIDSYVTFAKESGVKVEAAQKFLDQFVQGQQAVIQRAQEAVQEQHVKWAEETRADKEIGGANFEASVSAAKKALTQFGTPALSKMLAETGLGNNAEVIRFFAKVGKMVTEDSTVPAGGAADSKPTTVEQAAAGMYPKMMEYLKK